MFIACLSLLGLVSFIAESKTKEIDIRKALGASIGSIVKLFSKEFFWIILIANIFAWPIAYFAVDRRLQNFAYRINISMWIFALATVTTFFTSYLTIIYHTIKAAFTQPVEYLKYE